MYDPTEHEVTLLLRQIADGDTSASERLLPLIYDELRDRARRAMGSESGLTLQPTALVHEAWLKIAHADDQDYSSRNHFVSVAAKAMRQILVDRARARATEKRGGEPASRGARVTMSGVAGDGEAEGRALDVLDLQEALVTLEADHPRPARVAELKFFGGLEMAEIAAVLGASERTVYTDWRLAKAWLRRSLEGTS